MSERVLWNRLSLKLTAAFLVAAVMGVALVAALAYRSASGGFGAFLLHVEEMDALMGGRMGDMMGGGGIGPGGAVSLAEAQRDFLGNLTRSLWVAGLSGVALAIVLGAIFTRQIVAPLGRVTSAARRVAAGDLSQRVPARGRDELGEMARSFNAMAEALARDREARQTMVADIAHELRTPLSVLRGNVEAMLDGVLEPSRDNLALLHEETLLLARLVEDLRTLSLAEAGQLAMNVVPTDIKVLAARAVDGFEAQASARGVRLALEADQELPPARVDPDRTAQVLRNLLSNALRYTPEGGCITVRLSTTAEGPAVSVADTGVGIPAEDLPHVFERFYRVDRSRARATGGSGLGLAIARRLVEAQGGRIWAESAPGQGSVFFFTARAAE